MLLNDERAATEKRYNHPAGSQVSGQGIASLVLGTFAVAVSFLPVLGLPALVLGPLAIILAVIARSQQPRDTVTATAGLILGITGTVITLIVTALVILGFSQYSDTIRSFPFAASQAPAASDAPVADQTPDAAAPLPVPSAPVTGQPPGKNCGAAESAGAAGGQPVTFIVEGEPGKFFNVDYGTPMESGCAETATGRWEATMLMSDTSGAALSTWSDSGKDQKMACQIIIGGRIVGQSQFQGLGSCST